MHTLSNHFPQLNGPYGSRADICRLVYTANQGQVLMTRFGWLSPMNKLDLASSCRVPGLIYYVAKPKPFHPVTDD